MLIVGRYAITPQSTNNPTLKRVNLDSMTIETFQYPKLNEWGDYLTFLLADLQNGDIAYGGGPHILIIDRSTLKLKQTL